MYSTRSWLLPILLALPPFLSVFAIPVDGPVETGLANRNIVKRQDLDASVAPEDETDEEIAADGTGPLRKGAFIFQISYAS